MIILNAETKEKINEYHKNHGDIKIKIIKVIKDSKGYDAVLVRVRNKAGERYSCLDLMDAAGDFSELDGVLTEHEQEMVERFKEVNKL